MQVYGLSAVEFEEIKKKLSIEKEENFEIEINRSLIEELGTNEYYFDWCIWIR